MVFIPAILDELQKIAEAETAAGLLPGKPSKREKQIYHQLAAGSETPIKMDPHKAERYGGGAFIQEGAGEIVLGAKDYQALAHELGHAEIHKHLLGRLLQHPAARWVFQNLTIPTAAAAGAHLGATGKKIGLLAPVAAAAPTLLSELLATHIGAKKLEALGISPDEKKDYDDRTSDAFRSYLSGKPVDAALAGGFSALAAHLLSTVPAAATSH